MYFFIFSVFQWIYFLRAFFCDFFQSQFIEGAFRGSIEAFSFNNFSFCLFFSILYLRDNFSVVSFLFSLFFLSFISFFFEGKRGNFLAGFNPEEIFPDTNVSYKVYYILLSYIFLIYVYLFYLLQLLNYLNLILQLNQMYQHKLIILNLLLLDKLIDLIQLSHFYKNIYIAQENIHSFISQLFL